MDPVGLRAFDAVRSLAFRRKNSRAVRTQSLRRLNQPELDHVPIESSEHLQCIGSDSFGSRLTIRLHEAGKRAIRQHRQMPEEVVEDVGLYEIVELFRFANPDRDRESAMRQVREELILRNQ